MNYFFSPFCLHTHTQLVRIYMCIFINLIGNCNFFMFRLNSTLGDFSEMKWTRGDLSFIFDGENNLNSDTLSLMVLDNETKEYQKIKLLGSVSIYTN